MIQYQTISVGENRGRPRIYLQGRQLEEAGFKVDERFNLEMFDGYLVIKRHDDGARKVSGKKKRTVPVIDIRAWLSDCSNASSKLLRRHFQHDGYVTYFESTYHIPHFVPWLATTDRIGSCRGRKGGTSEGPS